MPRTQRLIVASLALVIGLLLGFFLSGLFSSKDVDTTDYSVPSMVVHLSDADLAFKVSLDTVMRVEHGQEVNGYTPDMLMATFPRLTPEDFAGAAAVVGQYDFKDGQLIYSNTEVVDAAADNLTNEGIRTMRENAYRRLGIATDKDVIAVMQFLKTAAVATSTPIVIPPATEEGTVCPQDAKLCPDGTSVGRTGLNCEFAACPGSSAGTKTVLCSEKQRGMMCTQQYEPVCASYQVQCIKAPCDPVPKTYGNDCTACSDENVISYTEGACAVE